MDNNELTVGSNNQSTEMRGVIADWSTSAGPGRWSRSARARSLCQAFNTYIGGTTINGGTLQLGSAGSIGSILGAVTVGNGSTFDVVNADTSGITGITQQRNDNLPQQYQRRQRRDHQYQHPRIQ